MKKQIDVVAGTVTFTFENGLAPLTIRTSEISTDTATHAMLHGLSQKIGDAAAISKTEENGYTVTEAMRRAEVEAMMEQLRTGSWNTRKAAAVKQNPAIAKIAEMRGITYTEAEAWIVEKAMADLA